MNMADEERCAESSRRAAEPGMASKLAVQLYVAGDDLGALNLVAEQLCMRSTTTASAHD